MAKKTRNTRGRIVSAAWKLFYEQGYEDTTVEEIIEQSHTSKGSFYHYFDGKDALLSTLSLLFDEKYEELRDTLDPDTPAMQQLLYLNAAPFGMIGDRLSLGLRYLPRFRLCLRTGSHRPKRPTGSCRPNRENRPFGPYG